MDNEYPTYANPPVVEVIAEFLFEGSENKPGWSTDTGEEFLKKAIPNCKQFEKIIHVSAEFQADSVHMGKSDVLKMRGLDKSSNKAVQVGNDFFACHVLRETEPHDFGKLIEHSSSVLGIYQEMFNPKKILRMGLWYVDIIEIPEDTIQISDYFNIRLVWPGVDSDAKVVKYDHRSLFKLASDSERFLDLHLQDIAHEDVSGCEFRIDWHLVEDELSDGIEWLEWFREARADLHDWFEQSLTPKCREMFGPRAEEK